MGNVKGLLHFYFVFASDELSKIIQIQPQAKTHKRANGGVSSVSQGLDDL